jgi:hypothetical protein
MATPFDLSSKLQYKIYYNIMCIYCFLHIYIQLIQKISESAGKEYRIEEYR